MWFLLSSLCIEFLIVAIEMKATEKWLSVLLFIMLYKVSNFWVLIV